MAAPQAIDQTHLFNICSKAQLEAELCAGRQQARYGTRDLALRHLGIGIDFGIQFGVRYRAERYEKDDLRTALHLEPVVRERRPEGQQLPVPDRDGRALGLSDQIVMLHRAHVGVELLPGPEDDRDDDAFG